jgi:hypothetical protein
MEFEGSPSNRDQEDFSDEVDEKISSVSNAVDTCDNCSDAFYSFNDEDDLNYEHDEDFGDLGPSEGLVFIKGHIQSYFEEIGMVHVHLATLNSFEEFFIQEEHYQYYNELLSLKHNELHVIQNPFQEDLQDNFENRIDANNIVDTFDIISYVSNIFFYNKVVVPNSNKIKPIYNEYLGHSKEKMSISTHMEIYSSKPIYDNYELNFKEGSEGNVEELPDQLTMSSLP